MEERAPRAYAQLIMSADTDPTRSAAADAVAAPLDLLLTDAATGMLRRVNPGGSGLRLAAALAARPRLVAGRGRQLAGRAGPHRRGPLAGAAVPAGPPVRRPGMGGQPAAAPRDAGLPGRRARPRKAWWPRPAWTEADSERVGFVLTNLIDALAPSNNPLLNPAAVKAAIDTGGGSALAGLRHFVADMAARAAGAVHGRAGRVRGRGGPGRHARVGDPADPGVRADPVPPGHARGAAGPAADRPAGDQQVLRDGPGARPEHGGVPGRQRPAGVHDLLAQPGRPAREMGSQHLRAGHPGRHGRGRADHRERADRARRGLLRRHHRRDGGRAPGAHRPAGPDRRVHPHGHRAGPGAGGPGQRRHRRADRASWPRPRPAPAATWTAGRWPRCSPGCGRTT